MILTNVIWGETLALGQRPGMYRCQSMGRVRMQTQPGPHQGLGVSSYAWSTSPIRRYADLVNQWQLLGILGHGHSPFRMGDAQLFADLAHFDGRYDRYAEFQSRMERYWSLRWLGFESGLIGESWDAVTEAKPLREIGSLTRHDGVVRLARIPTTVRIPEWASLAAGSRVEVDLLRFDALSLELEARPVRVVEESPLESYAVLGDPIDHSRSPAIHSAFAEQTDQAIRYEAIQVCPEELEQRLDELANQGYLGLNLTVPLKEHVIVLAKRRGWEISERARQAGAANTLIRSLDGWRCENTDGVGLVADLHELLGADGLRGQRLLLIGAGGAARGVVGPLLQAGAAQIVLANRTLAKARAIADEIDPKSIRAIDLKLIEAPQDIDGAPWPAIVINATSGSLQGQGLVIAPEIFLHSLLVLDMMYSANETPFLKQAREAGATRRVDGLGMLVGQAAESFAHWRGVRPDTAVVKEAIRASMNEEIE
jgi:shikimate dehydrogenase